MKQSTSFSLFSYSCLLFPLLSFFCPDALGQTGPALFGDSTDITEAMRALQRTMPPPPADFRAGHASPRQLDGYLEEKEEGFVIRLPRASLTPSPTVYRDLLLVSGGFGSKEFYAFDAGTGALRWALDLDDDGPSSAVVEDDIAVFNTESCTIFACHASTGELLWSHYLGDPLMSTPSIANGIVYTAYPAHGDAGSLSPVPNVQQQSMPQAYQPPAEANASPGSFSATHVLIALELRTGEIVWQRWIDGDIMSAPVVVGGQLLVTTFPGTFYRLDAGSGEILAARAERATSAPVVANGVVLMSRRAESAGEKVRESISAYDQDLTPTPFSYSRPAPYLDQEVQEKTHLKQAAMTYDAGNGFTGGAPAGSGWQRASQNIGQSNVSSLQAFQGSRVLHYDAKNYATMGDELVCTDADSGTVKWRQSLPGDLEREGGFLATPPLAVGGRVLIATLAGDLVFYDAETGEEWRRYTTGEAIRFQPVLVKGRIYVSTVGGKVLCIDTQDERLTGWPTWGADAAHTNRPAR